MLGLGIGIIIATFLLSGIKLNNKMNDKEIEIRARKMGMEYVKDEKVIPKERDGQSD